MGAGATFEPMLHLEGVLQRAAKVRTRTRERMQADPGLAAGYTELLGTLRNVSRGDAGPRELSRKLRGASYEIRHILAAHGAEEGASHAVLAHLPLFGLEAQDALDAAILCALSDPGRALEHLGDLPLDPPDSRLAVALAALSQQPRLDFEEYKVLETRYLADPGATDGRSSAQRRFEQARAQRSLHARRHLFGRLPGPLLEAPDARAALLGASLAQDPFGTLDHFRETGTEDPCAGLSTPQRLDLLDRMAALGWGLASTHLDLFHIPRETAWEARLQAILRQDILAGSTVFGVCALEGAQHYPFDLGRIEALLPRRITQAEALLHLRRGESPEAPPRTFTAAEISEASTHMQEREVARFLELLQSEVARQWAARVGPRKRELVFGDPGLKVRNVLFLLAHALFEEEARFERIYRTVQQNHPMSASQAPRMALLANRYYFLELLGIHPGLLYARAPRATGGTATLIEGAGDAPVRALLHVGMSIHLRVGDALFRETSIAWNMLLGQCEGHVDTVLQELAQLFERFDTLLTLAAPLLADPASWVGRLVEAVVADADELPGDTGTEPEGAFLRLATRNHLQRCRETLDRFALQALHRRAATTASTPTTVIQGLRLPKARTERLLVLLQRERRQGPATARS